MHVRTRLTTLFISLWAMPALAHHDHTPLREAVIDGHSHAVGGATLWLAGAAIALILALVAVQRTVFRAK